VDYQLLDSIERSLSSLYSEFQNIKARTGAYDGDLGSGAVASAMDGFAGNWDDHRQSLLNSIQTLGKMVSETRQQFQGTDNQLASSISKK
jgi:hypothetical protein